MRSWSAFVSLPFPDGCAGLETEGVCLVSLDTFAAGCVDTFVANRGCLDPNRIAVLEQSAADLSRVLPKLEGDARAYFNRLNDMVVAVLHECRR